MEEMKKLLLKYFKGQTSVEEEGTIRKFILESSENEAYFQSIKRLWEQSPSSDKETEDAFRELAGREKRRKLRKNVWMLPAAAAAVIICLLCHNQSRSESVTVSVPKGEQTQLTLSDGTKVWINAGSCFTYPEEFKKRKRMVSLDGEGYFEVHADTRHPFIVNARGCRFTVTGTRFNITAYEEEHKVTAILMEGKLEFKSGSTSYMMSPGELVCHSSMGMERKAVDTSQYQGWTKQIINYDKVQLPELLRRVSREFDVEISLDTDNFNYREIKASFKRDDSVESILNAISIFLPISFCQHEDGVWHITNKR